jgi:hypothetical protein
MAIPCVGFLVYAMGARDSHTVLAFVTIYGHFWDFWTHEDDHHDQSQVWKNRTRKQRRNQKRNWALSDFDHHGKYDGRLCPKKTITKENGRYRDNGDGDGNGDGNSKGNSNRIENPYGSPCKNRDQDGARDGNGDNGNVWK